MPSCKNAGKAAAAQNTDKHPFPHCLTWLSAEKLDMHCTVDDHRRHCCRLLKKKDGSQSSTRRARSDSCIRQCGPSKLLDCVSNTNILATIRRWIYNYMQNRRAKVHFQQKESKSENRSGTRRSYVTSTSIIIWPTFQHRLRTSS